MKKLITCLILLTTIFSLPGYAQTFGNEWINYGQSYYKFKVGKDNIYRISISSLHALGMPTTVSGSQLQLIREGKEIPLYVSNANTLSGTDFMEFYGEKANGAVDLPLYQFPEMQLNPDMNLLSDTAYYFITYNNLSTNLRWNESSNNISSPPQKEDYCWNRLRTNFRNEFVSGASAPEGNLPGGARYELNSSQYEVEGFVRRTTLATDSLNFTLTSAYKLAGAPQATIQTAVVGKAYSSHRTTVLLNNNLVTDSTYGSFDLKRFSVSMPMSWLPTSNIVQVKHVPDLTLPNDRFGVSYVDIKYPMIYNFANRMNFYFELSPKPTAYYLEITNFKSDGVAPRLYDLENKTYFIGDIATAGMVKFLIPASSITKRFMLQGQQTAALNPVTALQSVSFKNFNLTANQGNYIILTHTAYTNDGTGHDYVNDYKQYRASAVGGGFQPTVSYTEDLFNEFGYGYDYSSLALKNFLHFAHTHSSWVERPKYVFIIGKGFDYNRYLTYYQNKGPYYPFEAVPSFGEPSSDLLLTDFAKNNKPQIPIGRLTCFNGSDIGDYLQKVKEHEQVLASTVQTEEEKLWQKNFLHIAGTNNAAEQLPIVLSLKGHEDRISDPFYGGKVTTIKKGSTMEVETINSKIIDDVINNGVAFIQFFGHSSSTNIDYGLDFPENYTNFKKYYFFMANGCSAGDVFVLTPLKLLSEKFVLVPGRGSIGFIANVNTSFSDDLGIYTDSLYSHISTRSYGMGMGDQIQRNTASLMSNSGLASNFLFRMHCQQIQLNGDPAVKIFNYPKPDYLVESNDIAFNQLNLTSTVDSLDFKFRIHNLGRITNDSCKLVVKRQLPDNTEFFVVNKTIPAFSPTDSFEVRIPTLGETGVGLNTISIELDPDFLIDEISETNNKINYTFTIYNDDLLPVFPYNFSIVSQQGVVLSGSTLNTTADSRNYLIQIDTTETFNSPSFRTTMITSKGGVVKWQPNITLNEGSVYYWRMAMDTLYGNKFHRWTTYSFIYLNQQPPGWNQSHVYQWQKNNFTDCYVDSTSRTFKFSGENRTITVSNACMDGALGYNFGDYFVKQNGITMYTHGCDPSSYGSFQFVLIDSATGKVWQNKRPIPSVPLGKYGSWPPCLGDGVDSIKVNPFFEFSFKTAAWRKTIMDFLDSIPAGTYVMMQDRICLGGGCGNRNNVFINQWKADTTLYGSGNSLYHKLINMGFTQIDSFYKNRPMVYWTQKDRPQTVQQFVGIDTTIKLNPVFEFPATLFEGTMSSVKIGPAKSWTNFIKLPYSNDPTVIDSVVYSVSGIDSNGSETFLTHMANDTTLSFISATQYPYIRLSVLNKDNTYQTPEQLHYWRVHYTPVPEAALNGNLLYSFKDTLSQGEVGQFRMALENLTPYAMDSMLVHYTLIDKNSNKISLPPKRYKPLAGLDTISVELPLPSLNYPGRNTLIVEANPNKDQPEQYHPNNIAYRSFYVVPDSKNPVLDVTFDGIHILDKDIVSAKPFIQILLRDENKYLALDDTSLIEVYLKYPGNITDSVRIPFDGTILKFYPASTTGLDKKNQARLEFKPVFTEDGNDYVLIVQARDKTKNESGSSSYKVSFEVVNQPSITAVLNYPNPFTTHTQFVFTLTGSEVPSNMKIQILSVTGKVVREITSSELGLMHIGRNITEYKWPGDDQFGKPLGNGVYLYRVVSNLHGKNMDIRKSGADKWMEHGFGKLYIMR
jgi:hypothetical protein